MIVAKKMALFCIVSVLIFSCSSDPVEPPPVPPTALSLLQNKWVFQSVTIYEHIDFSGQSLAGPSGSGNDFYNFDTNGKMYGYMFGKLDSTNYQLKVDTLILFNTYYNGILSTETDTVSIRTMTKNSLIFCSKNPAGEYAKFVFYR